MKRGNVNKSSEFLRVFNPRYKSTNSSKERYSLQRILSENIEKPKIFIKNVAQAKKEYQEVKQKIELLFQKRKQENINNFNKYLSENKTSINNLSNLVFGFEEKLKSIKRIVEHREKHGDGALKLNIAQKRYLLYVSGLLRKSDQLLYYLREIKKIKNISKDKSLPEMFKKKIEAIDNKIENLNGIKSKFEKSLKESKDYLQNIIPNLERDHRLKAAGEVREVLEAKEYHEKEILKISSQIEDVSKKIQYQKKRKKDLTEKGHEENLKQFIKMQREKIPQLRQKFKERFPDFVTLYQLFMEERSSIQEKYYIDLYLTGKINDIK